MKIINDLGIYILVLVSIFTFYSCGHNHAEGDGHNHGTEKHSEDGGHDHGEAHEEGSIHLTKEQIKMMNIQFGDFSSAKINDFVSATGTLGLPPNALTSVSAKANGFISNSNKYVEGSYVKKGVIMAYLENPDFIQHQREYLEINAELVFDHQELARQEKLVSANAGVEKNVQRLQSQINRKTATLKAIAKQLDYLGISANNLTPDNIIQKVPIYAPMSGYITSIKMHNGMYVRPEMELMEIVNENHLHLELDVFEKDIAQIKIGQPINYTVPALGNTNYKGEVHIIGKEFNTSNKTVRLHGHLEGKRPKFIKDLFVEAKIWLNNETVQALPEKAIIKDGDFSYIYVASDDYEKEAEFEAIKVIAGLTENGFTSVKLIDTIPKGKKIVTQGAYYVFAQSKAGELAHEH